MTRHVTFNQPSEIDRPDAADMFRASVADPLALYETLASASFDLNTTATSVFAAYRTKNDPTGSMLATAKAAAQRVVNAIDAYEAGLAPLNSNAPGA